MFDRLQNFIWTGSTNVPPKNRSVSPQERQSERNPVGLSIGEGASSGSQPGMASIPMQPPLGPNDIEQIGPSAIPTPKASRKRSAGSGNDESQRSPKRQDRTEVEIEPAQIATTTTTTSRKRSAPLAPLESDSSSKRQTYANGDKHSTEGLSLGERVKVDPRLRMATEFPGFVGTESPALEKVSKKRKRKGEEHLSPVEHESVPVKKIKEGQLGSLSKGSSGRPRETTGSRLVPVVTSTPLDFRMKIGNYTKSIRDWINLEERPEEIWQNGLDTISATSVRELCLLLNVEDDKTLFQRCLDLKLGIGNIMKTLNGKHAANNLAYLTRTDNGKESNYTRLSKQLGKDLIVKMALRGGGYKAWKLFLKDEEIVKKLKEYGFFDVGDFTLEGAFLAHSGIKWTIDWMFEKEEGSDKNNVEKLRSMEFKLGKKTERFSRDDFFFMFNQESVSNFLRLLTAKVSDDSQDSRAQYLYKKGKTLYDISHLVNGAHGRKLCRHP